ncbi:MAG: leucine-rich repeat domain-containing protein [Clostridia bacterium]|nr:leucine-rich repeat domain-containing protein [Clostridia bacterium]
MWYTLFDKNRNVGSENLLKKIALLLITIVILAGFSSCAASPVSSPAEVDKTALISLLNDFEIIPQTLDQSTLVTAYSLILEKEQATQKEVNEAVAGLKELKETIYSTQMTFIDGGLEPHVRNALELDKNTVITIGDCLMLEELDCTYDEALGVKMRVSYDFRYFPNLKTLNLTGNAIEDLDGFAYLSKLETLSLAENPVRTATLSDEDSDDDVRSLEILGRLPIKNLDVSGESVLTSASLLPVMTGLETLNISGNSLDSLSFIATNCPNLKTLIASDCTVSTLQDLGGCNSLVSLDLSRTEASDLSFLSSLKQLSELTLDGVSFVDYPSLLKAPLLVSLSLSDCNVSDLSWISEFTVLEKLDLSHNQISDASLVNGSVSVKKINLSHNMISQFSLTDEWSGVEELNLSENAITAFSVSLVQGSGALKVLDLSSNAVTSFSADRAAALESVELSENALQYISLNSNSLRSISLSDNPLKGLSLNLPSLVSLELACNTVFSEPVSLNLPSLKILDLSKEFTCTSDLISSLNGLETLSIHLSGASAESVASLITVKDLTVYGGDDAAVSVISGLPALESLTVCNSKVTAPVISGNKTLKSLTFENCATLSDLSGVSDLSSLEIFSVTGGNLSAPHLSGLDALRTVRLSKCDLTTVSYLTDLNALTTLDLSENGLQSIEVLGFPHLQYLDLSDNKLSNLNGIALTLTRGTLDLSGNEPSLYEDLSSFPETLKVIVK